MTRPRGRRPGDPDVTRRTILEAASATFAEAGYEGVPAGPRKEMSTQEVLDDLASYGLKPAPTYMGGDLFRFNGNVPNSSLIDNLPRDVCVEVPVLGNMGIDMGYGFDEELGGEWQVHYRFGMEY